MPRSCGRGRCPEFPVGLEDLRPGTWVNSRNDYLVKIMDDLVPLGNEPAGVIIHVDAVAMMGFALMIRSRGDLDVAIR